MRSLLASLAVVTTFAGQASIDLSGTWKLDNGKSLYPGGTPNGHVITIAQTAAELTMTSTAEGWQKPLSHKLNAETRRKGRNSEVTTNTRWKGSTLVVTTTRVLHQRDGSTVTYVSTDSFTLLSPDELIVERLMKAPRGEQGFKLVYKRQR